MSLKQHHSLHNTLPVSEIRTSVASSSTLTRFDIALLSLSFTHASSVLVIVLIIFNEI